MFDISSGWALWTFRSCTVCVCSHYSSLALIVLPHRIFASSSSLTYTYTSSHTRTCTHTNTPPHIYHTLDKTDHTTQIECISQDDIKPPRSTLTHRRRRRRRWRRRHCNAYFAHLLFNIYRRLARRQHVYAYPTWTIYVLCSARSLAGMLAKSSMVTFGFVCGADRSRRRSPTRVTGKSSLSLSLSGCLRASSSRQAAEPKLVGDNAVTRAIHYRICHRSHLKITHAQHIEHGSRCWCCCRCCCCRFRPDRTHWKTKMFRSRCHEKKLLVSKNVAEEIADRDTQNTHTHPHNHPAPPKNPFAIA